MATMYILGIPVLLFERMYFFFQENRDLKLEKNKNKNLAFISFLSKQLKLIKDEVKTWEVKYFFLVFQQIQLGHEV